MILRSPYMGAARLTRARYQQMIGRAGRAGFDTHGESIMIVKTTELSFITEEILLAPTDRVESQLAGDSMRGLQQLILSLVTLDLGGKDRCQLADTVLHSTLIGQQVKSYPQISLKFEYIKLNRFEIPKNPQNEPKYSQNIPQNPSNPHKYP